MGSTTGGCGSGGGCCLTVFLNLTEQNKQMREERDASRADKAVAEKALAKVNAALTASEKKRRRAEASLEESKKKAKLQRVAEPVLSVNQVNELFKPCPKCLRIYSARGIAYHVARCKMPAPSTKAKKTTATKEKDSAKKPQAKKPQAKKPQAKKTQAKTKTTKKPQAKKASSKKPQAQASSAASSSKAASPAEEVTTSEKKYPFAVGDFVKAKWPQGVYFAIVTGVEPSKIYIEGTYEKDEDDCKAGDTWKAVIDKKKYSCISKVDANATATKRFELTKSDRARLQVPQDWRVDGFPMFLRYVKFLSHETEQRCLTIIDELVEGGGIKDEEGVLYFNDVYVTLEGDIEKAVQKVKKKTSQAGLSLIGWKVCQALSYLSEYQKYVFDNQTKSQGKKVNCAKETRSFSSIVI